MSVTTVSSTNTGSIASHHFDDGCHSSFRITEPAANELENGGSQPTAAVVHSDGEGAGDSSALSASQEDSDAGSAHIISSFMNLSVYKDDRHVYANMDAIESKQRCDEIDRRPKPPIPGPEDKPIRVLPSGWQEFRTVGGRTYYHHPIFDIGQWKPPRGNQTAPIMLTRQKTNESMASSIAESRCDTDKSLSGNGVPTTTFPVDANDQVISPPLTNDPDTSKRLEPDQAVVMSQSLNTSVSKHNVAAMTNSVDSGLGRSSISYKNHAFGLAKPNVPQHVYDSVVDMFDPKPTSSDFFDHIGFPNPNSDVMSVKKGTLEKLKIADSGIIVKKKEWVSAYAFLYSCHLLFYKDQKRAEKRGKHYPTPTDVCDLRGAKLSFVDCSRVKDKRRKTIIKLVMSNNTEYWFSLPGNDAEVESWFRVLTHTINALPQPKMYPLPPTADPEHSESGPLVVHNKAVASVSRGSRRGSQKNSKVSKTPSCSTDDPSLTRDSIIERLLRFFRSRPSVEQLRERGIYKPEPIFGSTLAAICQHDDANVPRFITEITRVIEEKGLNVDGIYRVSGNLSFIQKIRCQIDQDNYLAIHKEDDIHVLTGALKLFFRELSDPIFPIVLHKEFMVANRQQNLKLKIKMINDLLAKLPLSHLETLHLLFLHLLRVAGNSEKNRMNIHSLAIMFGPALFDSDDKPAVKSSPTTADKKGTNKKQQRKRVNGRTETSNEPNQILAYKLIVYGQIVEFILKEFNKFPVFIPSS